MMETLEAAGSAGGDGFARILASLSSTQSSDSGEWNVDGLADDVATIGNVNFSGVAETRTGAPDSVLRMDAEPETNLSAEPGGTAQRKSASVTIRLTRGECDQLHERAAAAGMTISAYIRSCTFEVEALRAQVKEALAQFNSAAASEQKTPEKASNWRSKFFPRWSGYGSGVVLSYPKR
jgi:hypothetical protein